jgi:uncharacterized protein (DUF2267 family)/osmotically-inducible protein OsmY
MRTAARRTAEGLAVVGGAVLLRPGARANRALRHQAKLLSRHLRHFGGRLHGVSYRFAGRHPDDEVSGNTLADRIRSTLGPLEKRLDLPHVHVMAEDHVALLHGEVGTAAEADEIEAAVADVSGVRGVESYLHVGLGRGDTRPSAGRAVEQPSGARHGLLTAATSTGVDASVAPAVVRAILATFAERLPDDERDQVATHLPADVRSMFTPPRRLRDLAPSPRTTAELVGRIVATTEALPAGRETDVTRAVIHELRALVPDEAADVAAVLPEDLRRMWEQR